MKIKFLLSSGKAIWKNNKPFLVFVFTLLVLYSLLKIIFYYYNYQFIFNNTKENINLDLTFELRNSDEVTVFHHGAFISTKSDSQKGIYTITGILQSNLLNAGIYRFNFIFGENQRYALFVVHDFNQFEILNETVGSNSFQLPGVIRPNIQYKIAFQEKYELIPG